MSAAAVMNGTDARVHDGYSFRAANPIDPKLLARITAALGYDPIEAATLPEQANIGEGCGNPLLIAKLSKGETVVDLGSGGGFDALLAAKRVGENGKVIGVDMTKSMIELARKNAARANVQNVEFKLSKITKLPVEDNTADCIISNCVLNLVADNEKRAIFSEAHRVLKPGGRMAVSDFLALKPLTEEMKNDGALFAGCVSGAIEVPLMEKYLKEAGFQDVLLVDSKKDLSLYKEGDSSVSVTPCCAGGSCGPTVNTSGRQELDYDINEWISSFQIFGIKGDAPQMSAVSSVVQEGGPVGAKSTCGCSPGKC